MNEIIAVFQWLELPHEVRLRLHDVFNLKKSTSVSVEQRRLGSYLVSDGHTQEDLLGITLTKLTEYVGFASGNFYELWQEAVKKAVCEVKGEVYKKPEIKETKQSTITGQEIDQKVAQYNEDKESLSKEDFDKKYPVGQVIINSDIKKDVKKTTKTTKTSSKVKSVGREAEGN